MTTAHALTLGAAAVAGAALGVMIELPGKVHGPLLISAVLVTIAALVTWFGAHAPRNNIFQERELLSEARRGTAQIEQMLRRESTNRRRATVRRRDRPTG